MNENQKLIIEGSLLGDGCLKRLKKHPTWNWSFSKNQSRFDIDGCNKRPYLEYHKDCIDSFLFGNIHEYRHDPVLIGERTVSETFGYVYTTRTHPLLTKLGKQWYVINEDNTRTKIVPKSLTLSPLSMCIWYMDDGSKEMGLNRCRIATNGFTHDEVGRLCKLINSTFGLRSRKIQNPKDEPMIEIGGFGDYRKFYEVVAPCVSWNCFHHKIEPPRTIVSLAGEDHPQAKLSANDVGSVIEMYNIGMTQKEIAPLFGVKKNTISTILTRGSWKQCDMPHLGQGTKGERNPNAKLTKEQVSEILSLKGTMSYANIGTRFGVGKSMVSHIMNGRCWT